MATEKEVLERKKETSDKVSTQVRTMGLGLLAFTWGLIISDSPLAKAIAETLKWHLLVIGFLSILTVFLDFLQYVVGYQVALRLLRSMEARGADTGDYNYESFLWRAQNWLFYAKQILLAMAASYLLIAVAVFLLVKVF
jgi:hypothetical protein